MCVRVCVYEVCVCTCVCACALKCCGRTCVVLDTLVLIPIFDTSTTHIPSIHA